MYKVYKFYPLELNRQQLREDKFAQEHIAGDSSEAFRRQGFWPLLQQHLVKGKRYLDAGCGVGGWILFLHDEGYTIEGIDTAARTVRALTEYDPTLEVKIAPMTRMPYADGYFDGLLAIGTLEYIEDNIPLALQEVRRVLAPGGLFFLEVPLANALRRYLYFPLKKIEYVFKKRQGQHPTFTNYFFQPAELRQLLLDHGFEVVQIQPHELPVSDGHYGLYVDWRIFRGSQPYQLNLLGQLVKSLCNAISPWVASTGMVIVARKSKT